MNNFSLKFFSKKLPKKSFSLHLQHSSSSTLKTSNFFCRNYHAHTHHHHQWRSTSSSTASGLLFFRSFSNHAIFSKGPIINKFLGSRFGSFLTRLCNNSSPKSSIFNPEESPELFKRWVEWLDRHCSSDMVLCILIFANSAVYLMWQVLPQDLMYKHFTFSLDNLWSGRIHTILTCAFSHFDVVHFGSNMMGLFFFGRSMGVMLGPAPLLLTYLLGAQFGCFTYAMQSGLRLLLQLTKNGEIPAVDPLLGANGAVNTIVYTFMLLFHGRVFFRVFIPIPASIIASLIIGADLFRILQGDPNGGSTQMLSAAALAAGLFLRF